VGLLILNGYIRPKLNKNSAMRRLYITWFAVLIACNNHSENKTAVPDTMTKENDGVKQVNDSVLHQKDPLNTRDTAFVAVGNEPFWGLTMVKNKTVSFRLADETKIHEFAYSGPSFILVKKKIYLFKNSEDSLRLEISEKKCSDGMSDKNYSHFVLAVLDGKKYSGCGESRMNWPDY
jgi:uncharacterized membrane protein